MTILEILFSSASVLILAYTAYWLVEYTKATQDILKETAESNELLKKQLKSSKKQLQLAGEALAFEKRKATGAALPFIEKTSSGQKGNELQYEFRNTGSKVFNLKGEILKQEDSAFRASITPRPPAGNLSPQYQLQVTGPFDAQPSTYVVFTFTNMLGEEGRLYFRAVKGGDLHPTDESGVPL